MIPGGPRVSEVDGLLKVEWPQGKPNAFAITPELFEKMTDEINEYRKLKKENDSETTSRDHGGKDIP